MVVKKNLHYLVLLIVVVLNTIALFVVTLHKPQPIILQMPSIEHPQQPSPKMRPGDDRDAPPFNPPTFGEV